MSKCRYEAIGRKKCAETPALYACSPCREMSAFERNETTEVSAGPLRKLRDMSADERARMVDVIARTLSERSPLQEYIAKTERDILNSAAVPHFVMMGTPNIVGHDWRREHLGAWTTTTTALEAEEQRQRNETTPCPRCGKPTRKGGIHFCIAMWKDGMDGSRIDHHVEALQYALAGRRSGKTSAVEEHVSTGHNARGERVYDFPCVCGRVMRGTDRDRGRLCAVCCEPKPPTLREWLGDRMSELGPWADVLREQPVPRGWIQRWESYRVGDTWELVAHGRARSETITPTDAIYAIGTWPADPYGETSEALQMALFTRHPAVKPEPRKPTLRTWFGNEEEP